ncbi:MAG TPA: biopolymer transporter Tol [Ignavibacteria bacterium]|nr:biopolymer transporter Tol [Ignavibacteria bacterium]
MTKIFKAFAVISILTLSISAQYNEYEPDYEWLTIERKNISVHYHPEAERSAMVVAKIAEEIWEPITMLYRYEPDRVHYVIKDIDDYANGATFFFDNKIEIWASSLDFDLRGTHHWLRNVISHEFTHMVQLQAGMKLSRSVPVFYLQFLNYEDKRRPDILYGYPNFIASYPIPTINIPAWFAEGTAQYMRTEFNYDNWDSHRDMILRSYVLDGNMLTWNQMGVFNKSSLGNESVYNSGFALTKYISQKYGEDKIREITEKLGKLSNFTFDAAVHDVLGITGNELYNEWKNFLQKDYSERIADVKSNLVVGDTIRSEGFGNFYPVYKEDGKTIIYVSNKNADYFSLSSIFEYNLETKEETLLVPGIRSTFGLIPGANKILYAKLTDKNPNSISIHDLYTYDLKEKEEKRITYGWRANNPTVSNDGKKVAFVFQKDGTTNLAVSDIDGKNYQVLTHFKNGEQVYNPKFSNDNLHIVFDYSFHHGRDIAKINLDGTGFEFLIQTDSDERNPVYDNEGNLIFSSDETGIFNIYKKNMQTGEIKRLTNVIGGAFMPDVNQNGDIVYAGYTSGGYKIFKLKSESQDEVDDSKKYTWIYNPPLDSDKPDQSAAIKNVDALKYFNDVDLTGFESKKYFGSFTKIAFYPFIRYDNYNTSNDLTDRIKPGVYVTSSDILNRFGFFAGGAINKRLERDLFLIFDYRDKLPLIYSLGLKPELSLELYSISREAQVDLIFDSLDAVNNTVGTDVTYNLFEVDFVVKHRIFKNIEDFEFRYIFSQYVATLGSFIFPNTTYLYPTTNDKYFIGSNFQFKFNFNDYRANVDSDINPIGREIELQYNYEMNRYNNDGEYEIDDGVLKPLYNNYNFHRLELNYKEQIETIKGHTISARLRAGTIFGPEVPDFFDFYLGGLTGMRAYPFYAISGNEIAWLNLTYRFPLFRNIDTRIGHFYLDKIFLSVHGDIGNAWNGDIPAIDTFKRGAGFELRIKMNSFYLFPTSLFFNASYSFDKFTTRVLNEDVTYGKEWQFYGGILFDFSL